MAGQKRKAGKATAINRGVDVLGAESRQLRRIALAAFGEIRSGLTDCLRSHPELAGSRRWKAECEVPPGPWRGPGLDDREIAREATNHLLKLLFLVLADGRGLRPAASRLRLFTDNSGPDGLNLPDSSRREALRILGYGPPSGRIWRGRTGLDRIDVRRLGDVYEAVLEYAGGEGKCDVRRAGTEGGGSNKPGCTRRPVSERKKAGRYYTPYPVVDYMIRKALGRRLKGLSSDEILSLRVVDPAMGSGRFLLHAVDYLAEAYGRALAREQDGKSRGRHRDTDRYRKMVIRRCVYGIDTDHIAVEIGRAALWLHAGGGPKTMQALRRHLRCGDALTGSVFAGSGFGFDVVLGNPPYVSFSGRQRSDEVYASTGPGRRRARVKGWPSAHGRFILRAVELLNQRGFLSFITPGQVGHLRGYGPVRAALLYDCDLLEVRYWGEGVFKGVTTPALTFVARKRGKKGRSTCRLTREKGGSEVFKPDGEAPWFASPHKGTLRRMAEVHPTIETFGDPGVHTGNAASRILAAKPKPGWVPVLEGKQIRPFRCSTPTRWLNLSHKPGPDEYFRISPPRVYRDTDIIIRQTAARPVAARHSHRCHFRNSILALKVPEGFSVEYLLGILNSEAAAMLYRALAPEAGQRAFPQIKVSVLRQLPIPDPRCRRNRAAVRRIERVVMTIESHMEAGKPADRQVGKLNTLVWNIYGMPAK